MPAKTTEKGEIGEAMVIADVIRQGHDVAIPFGHNQPFDLMVIRKEDGRLEKVQVKYTASDGEVIRAVIRSSSAWVHTVTRVKKSTGSLSTNPNLSHVSTSLPSCGTGIINLP